MIEDKELGLKVAENKDEAFWYKLKQNSEEEIKNNERGIIINQRIILLAEEKLKEFGGKENGE